MQHKHILLLVGAAVATATALPAQDLTLQNNQRVDARIAIRRSIGTADVDGGVLGAGRHYEAILGRGSMTFMPVFGDRAPEALPLSFTLESIRRGSAVVFDVVEAGDAKPRRDDASLWYDRGAGIVERYEVRSEGLEQTFTFSQPLPGEGDLVVRGRIATTLAAAPNADGGVDFRLAGVGGVSFGGVTGIDARGVRAPGAVRVDGDVLELVLPASLVDGASWPLVLDPLIGVQFEANGAQGATYDDSESDVAYDATNDNYLVVWKRKFAVGYSLIRGQRVSGAGAQIGSTLFFVGAAAGTVQSRPRVANVNLRDRYLVVWQQMLGPVGPRDIHGVTVDAATGALSAVVPLINGPGDEYNPCLGSEATTSDDEALLAWQDANGINLVQVNLPASGDPALLGSPTTVGSLFSTDPFLSKSGGSTGNYVLGWTAVNLLSDSEIAVQGVTRNAALVGSTVTVTANSLGDGAGAVDGDGTRFLLVWQQQEGAGGTYDIVCRGLNLSGSALTLVGSEQRLGGAAGLNDVNPDVAFLGGKYGVFWVQELSSFLDDIWGTIVNADCTTCGAAFALTGINNPNHNTEFEPRCVGQFAGGGASDHGFLVFSEAENAPPFEGDLVGQRFEAVGPGLPPAIVGPGCGLGGVAGTNGPFAVGNASFQFTLTGAQPTAVVFLSIALPGAPIVCGPCGLTNPVSFEFKVNIGGNATSTFAVPCNPAFIGSTIETQWVSFFSTANPCPAVSGLSTSPRLTVTVSN